LADAIYDQADGLRRMFGADRMRVIHVVAGRGDVGRTTAAVNLGVALARAGRDTLLIDCVDRGMSGRALAYLGLEPRLAVAGHSIVSSIVAGPQGLSVLPLDAAILGAAAPGDGARSAASAALLDYAAALDFVLVSSRSARSVELLPIESERREVVVVLSRATSSITEAYALVKRLSTRGIKRRFQVLVNRVESEAEAALIFRNMADVAQGYLDVQLELLGFVPADDGLTRASHEGKSVLWSAPKSSAARAFRRLADDIAGWSMASHGPAAPQDRGYPMRAEQA